MSVTDPRLAQMMADEEQAHEEYQAALAEVAGLQEKLERARAELPTLQILASGATRVRREYEQALAEGTLDEWEAR